MPKIIPRKAAENAEYTSASFFSNAAPYTVNDHYRVEQSRILDTIFPGRTVVVLGQYSSMGLYPDLAAPEFNQHGGIFTNSTAVSLTGSTTIYYTLDGSDPREYGTSDVAGRFFVHILLMYDIRTGLIVL